MSTRTLALLDVENLLPGGPTGATTSSYVDAVQRAADLAGLPPDAAVALGVGSRNITGVFASKSAWTGAAVRCRAGRDGAELALLRHGSDLDAIERSYDRVVIGSGDGMFTTYVESLNLRGVHTVVVAWPNQLSKRLRMAAAETRLLTLTSSVEHSQLLAA